MKKDFSKNLWRTKEFAVLAKVTVRTLHHYDRIGILKPKHYDHNGFRLYGESEFARLQQISTLKFIGFSLSQIKKILGEKEFDLAETLLLQRKIIEAQRNRLNLTLKAINQAEKVFRENGSTDWESFNQIIEVINMEQNWEWTRKYYSDEALAKIEERKNLWSPELQEKVTKQWSELIAEVEAEMQKGAKPSDTNVQKLAARWSELVDEFTGGDKEVQAGLNKMYADKDNWQTDWNKHKPFSDEVWNFISEAMKNNSN